MAQLSDQRVEKGKPREADNESWGGCRGGGAQENGPRKGFVNCRAHPELLCADLLVSSTPKTFRTELTETAVPAPDWSPDGSRVAQVKTAPQRWQWNQHTQKPQRQELRPNPELTICYTRLSTFSTGFKQDPASHNIIFKISRIQSKLTGHVKHQKIPSSRGKRQSANANNETTLTPEKPDEDSKQLMIKMLQQSINNQS